MDLYWTARCALCARNTSFSFSLRGYYGLSGGAHVVYPFGMADWLNRLRAFINYTVFLIKGLAQADLAKKRFKIFFFFWHECLLFYVRLLCSINFCFGPVEIQQFKNNCSGLKIDWGPPMQLFTECVLRHYILLFYTSFCRLGVQTCRAT